MSRRTRDRFALDRAMFREFAPLTVSDFVEGMRREDAAGLTARDAWVRWLRPQFADSEAAYFTGTYNDEYGYDYGLTLNRNVQKDFERFLDMAGLADRDFVCGVEAHRFRDVLHCHAIIEGPISGQHRMVLKELWQYGGGRFGRRGFAKVYPVLDGCESYVTKYALKGDTDNFSFRLTRRPAGMSQNSSVELEQHFSQMRMEA